MLKYIGFVRGPVDSLASHAKYSSWIKIRQFFKNHTYFCGGNSITIILLIALLLSCTKRTETMNNEQVISIKEIDTTVKYSFNDTSSEIFYVKYFGYSSSHIRHENIFTDNNGRSKFVFVINSLDELMLKLDRYFVLPDFEALPDNFFKNNCLVFILYPYTIGTSLNNARIEQRDNNYFLIIEQWHRRGAPLAAGFDEVLYVLKLPKN